MVQLSHNATPSTFQVRASSPDKSTMHVAVDIYTPSFFGDLLPRGGFRGHVESVAEQQSRSPLCVLSSDGARALALTETAQLSGPCVIHSNGDVQAAKGTQLVAERVEATGKATGAISPAPRTGAPRIEDPLTSMDLRPPSACGTPVDHVYNTGDVIPAGVLNENIIVNNNNMPTLAPGVHYLCGMFTIWVNATVSGSNTAIVMTKTASWDMHTNSHIIITGLQTGTLAGLVLGVTPDQSGDYMLPTNPFDTITGVIYAPSVNLKLYGNKAAGELSDWTIVIAKGLAATQAANLQIRTNYKNSPTPVPAGVGDHVSQVAIVR